ncbi:hypothetical protein M9H77_07105 [Catharanthus roseus]|uniref:Uncharacterized protein n=1 Tax=Catharanthus roseus TaxID=4058 RepID=A0ACC0BU60_CATRO|nr:hypothetical protein M9H77_07105 [Catharanthus roseus]
MISYDYVGSALKFIFRLDEDPRLTSGYTRKEGTSGNWHSCSRESGEFGDWDIISSELLEKIHICKPIIKGDCFHLLDYLSHCEFSVEDLVTLMGIIIFNLTTFLNSKVDLIPDEKVKFESLREDILFFQKVFQLPVNSSKSEEEIESLGETLELFEVDF